jgi:Tfp pilus assembly PilM family ATPase
MATETRSAINTDELVQQAQTAFDIWLSGEEVNSIRMLELAGRLGRLERYDARLQRYCGIAWELAERSVQPRR